MSTAACARFEGPSFDLVVVGAGMAGLTAGAVAAELGGARVAVLERAPAIGGSAILSGGDDPNARTVLCELGRLFGVDLERPISLP